MKSDPQYKVADNPERSVRITPAMVQARAEELAVIKGRRASDVTQSDLTQARRELTGTPDAKA